MLSLSRQTRSCQVNNQISLLYWLQMEVAHSLPPMGLLSNHMTVIQTQGSTEGGTKCLPQQRCWFCPFFAANDWYRRIVQSKEQIWGPKTSSIREWKRNFQGLRGEKQGTQIVPPHTLASKYSPIKVVESLPCWLSPPLMNAVHKNRLHLPSPWLLPPATFLLSPPKYVLDGIFQLWLRWRGSVWHPGDFLID